MVLRLRVVLGSCSSCVILLFFSSIHKCVHDKEKGDESKKWNFKITKTFTLIKRNKLENEERKLIAIVLLNEKEPFDSHAMQIIFRVRIYENWGKKMRKSISPIFMGATKDHEQNISANYFGDFYIVRMEEGKVHSCIYVKREYFLLLSGQNKCAWSKAHFWSFVDELN